MGVTDMTNILISIHTPAKGVTSLRKWGENLGVISIHTPAKGVTDMAFAGLHALSISIHTPAKGVTNVPGNMHNT